MPPPSRAGETSVPLLLYTPAVFVFVIIPVHNRLEYTRECLASLLGQTCNDYHVVVVDDGSTDGTHAALEADHSGVTPLWGDGDLWWTGAMNRGVNWVLSRANADDCILALNNDTGVPPDYLQTLVALAKQHPRALIGSVAVSWDDHERIVDGGVRIDWRTTRSYSPAEGLTRSDALRQLGDSVPVSVLSGRGTLIPVQAFQEVGLYDQRRLPHYAADWEFARRAQRAGFELIMSYAAPVYSHERATGLNPSTQRLSAGEFMSAYLSRRSPHNLAARITFARLCAEPWAVPLYTTIDLARALGGGAKHQLVLRGKGRA